MRSTSTMRATRRSVVRPRLSSDAQSRATAPFFEELTSMRPDSSCPPLTRRCECLGAPNVMISESRAALIRASMSRLTFCEPCSIRWIALWLVPSLSAS
ncbi:hypothetical protein D3C74_359640 [compost metagenome]